MKASLTITEKTCSQKLWKQSSRGMYVYAWTVHFNVKKEWKHCHQDDRNTACPDSPNLHASPGGTDERVAPWRENVQRRAASDGKGDSTVVGF